MVGRRHGWDEIAGKLARADELTAKGKNRREVSKALGISIMTYHRWRKLQHRPNMTQDDAGKPEDASKRDGASRQDRESEQDLESKQESASNKRAFTRGWAEGLDAGSSHGGWNLPTPGDRMRKLEAENLKLRRLVTDLLLEKLALEDELRALHDPG